MRSSKLLWKDTLHLLVLAVPELGSSDRVIIFAHRAGEPNEPCRVACPRCGDEDSDDQDGVIMLFITVLATITGNAAQQGLFGSPAPREQWL